VKGFVYRLIPPRPTFALDMSEAEGETMQAHVEYWSKLAADGRALAFGPVLDGEAGYGLGVVLAEDIDEAQRLRAEDPAIRSPHGFRVEIAPFLRLVTPDATYG
jgi:uncharacterized protein